MAELFLFAGTKGGIGKTLCASLLIDAAIEANLIPVVYDCDNENHSLADVFCHADIKINEINPDDGNSAYPLDIVVNDIMKAAQSENIFVVDMKAGTTRSTLDWLKYVPFSELAEHNISVYIIGCITGEVESCTTFMRWLTFCNQIFINGEAKPLIIKNLYAGSNFWYYDQVLQPFIDKELPSSIIVQIPVLTAEYVMMAKKAHLTYGQILRQTDKPTIPLQFMQRVRIRKQYSAAIEPFAKILRPNAASRKGKEKQYGGK